MPANDPPLDYCPQCEPWMAGNECPTCHGSGRSESPIVAELLPYARRTTILTGVPPELLRRTIDEIDALNKIVARWERIADDLMRALESFMAYDGCGGGGAADSNRGDWRAADSAEAAYRKAKGNA